MATTTEQKTTSKHDTTKRQTTSQRETTERAKQCGLTVFDDCIKWNGNYFQVDSSIRMFFEFVHGEPFKGIALDALFNLYDGSTTFDILAYKPDEVVIPTGVRANKRKAVSLKPTLYKNNVAIVKGNSLREFLELNYVPLGKGYKKNPCKTNLDEWISSGRLEEFQTAFTRIQIRYLTVFECEYVDHDLSEEFKKTNHQYPMQKEKTVDRLKRLISFTLTGLDKLEESGHVLPESYDLRSFMQGELSKRQRTTTTSSTSTEETPFVNPLNQ